MLLLLLVFYSLIAVFIIQIAYYIFFLKGFAFKEKAKSVIKKHPVSLIICAKNEAQNLKENIPLLINQDYPEYEIILVNDDSSDNTLDVMKSFKAQYKNIEIVDVKSVEKFWGNKKYALTLGIKASKHEFLLFTDADCRPASKNWIAEMSSHFSNSKHIVLGYGSHEKQPNSALNKIIRFETLVTAIQYFSYANLGMPYMGVGRNLAYRKALFFNAGGFMNHMDILSGDDDLFINDVADHKNTSVSMSPDSFTISKSKTSFKSWVTQKRRHISTAKHYKLKHKLLLSLFYFTQFSFWLFSFILLINMFKWQVVLAILVIRLALQIVTIYCSAKKLYELDLVIWAPFLELFLIVFQFSIFIANLISKPNHWK